MVAFTEPVPRTTYPPLPKIRGVALRVFQRKMYAELKDTPVILNKNGEPTFLVIAIPESLKESVENCSIYFVDNSDLARYPKQDLSPESSSFADPLMYKGKPVVPPEQQYMCMRCKTVGTEAEIKKHNHFAHPGEEVRMLPGETAELEYRGAPVIGDFNISWGEKIKRFVTRKGEMFAGLSRLVDDQTGEATPPTRWERIKKFFSKKIL